MKTSSSRIIGVWVRIPETPFLKTRERNKYKMTNTEKLVLMKNRYKKLAGSDKNIKSGGVLRKLRRQIRNLEQVV